MTSNEISCCAAISACEKGGQLKGALNLMTFDGQESQVTSNEVSCHAAISACEKGGRWKRAWNLFRFDVLDAGDVK